MQVTDEYLLTLDVDWAPDCAIRNLTNSLVKKQICATWFITHDSPEIRNLRHHSDLFELGIHPNFLPGSTQGRSPAEVLRHCMALVPDAKSIRSHGLLQSTSILNTIIERTPIEIDVSLFLPSTPFIRPCEYYAHGKKLLRIPYFWEDDFEMDHPTPYWDLPGSQYSGLKIMNFHPIHVHLNSENMGAYETLKRQKIPIQQMEEDDLADYINHGHKGTAIMFNKVLEKLSSQGSRKIHDLAGGYIS